MLSLHVLSAIVTIGPVTVAAWLFLVLGRGGALAGVENPSGVSLGFLHRINVAGSIAALAVPVFGVATAVQLGVLTDTWLIIAITLTAIAAGVFVWGVVPGQRRAIASTVRPAPMSALLWRSTVIFTVLWMIVVVLMIFRPGSTAGVAA